LAASCSDRQPAAGCGGLEPRRLQLPEAWLPRASRPTSARATTSASRECPGCLRLANTGPLASPVTSPEFVPAWASRARHSSLSSCRLGVSVRQSFSVGIDALGFVPPHGRARAGAPRLSVSIRTRSSRLRHTRGRYRARRFTRENVAAVSFSEHANAYERAAPTEGARREGEVSVRGASVVVRGEDGEIVTKEQIGDETWEGTAEGSLAC
jgi:hypothetical protein